MHSMARGLITKLFQIYGKSLYSQASTLGSRLPQNLNQVTLYHPSESIQRNYLHGSSIVCEGWGLDPIGELTIEPSPSSDKYPAGDLKIKKSKKRWLL